MKTNGRSIKEFDSLYRHGFVRAALCVPHVAPASPSDNVDATIALARRAAEQGCRIFLFPELGVSAYAIDDLLQQDALDDAVGRSLTRLAEESAKTPGLFLIGAPIRKEARLFNCAVAISAGQILGVVPKSYLPNYREFYEKRHFCSGQDLAEDPMSIEVGDQRVPFGTNLIFDADDADDLVVHVEICEDLWSPVPPSTFGALAGATVLCNLSASNATIAKAEYRRDLCASQSGRTISSYLYCAAGPGESTTDLAWDGHAIAYENDELIAESKRFSDEAQVIPVDIDLDRLTHDRLRTTSFNDAVARHSEQVRRFRRIGFSISPPEAPVTLAREIDRFPYVPNSDEQREARCFDAHSIQVQGLATRLRATGIDRVVIGVSGGLDSTQALLVAARAFDSLGLDRSGILAYTLPGFATSRRTKSSADRLMSALGVTGNEIDIRPLSRAMLESIDHPVAHGAAVYDVTYENVQAGARTSLLFRLANHHRALVVGTGDLSELALGWTTYGVGDQMSHYNVNASVPKTLMRYLIGWTIDSGEFTADVNEVLRDVLATAISPELVPGRDGEDHPAQVTEEVIGPYELQDFNLYYTSRYGYRPSKVAWLAWNAWRDAGQGDWPSGVEEPDRRSYDLTTVASWLHLFLSRFFGSTQFKRSAMPNGPKVGSGGSLSPRGDWRAPSDSSATIWIDELIRNLPDEVADVLRNRP